MGLMVSNMSILLLVKMGDSDAVLFKEKVEKKGNKAMMDPCKKVYLPT